MRRHKIPGMLAEHVARQDHNRLAGRYHRRRLALARKPRSRPVLVGSKIQTKAAPSLIQPAKPNDLLRLLRRRGER